MAKHPLPARRILAQGLVVVALACFLTWLFLGRSGPIAGAALPGSLASLALACATHPRWRSLAFTVWVIAFVTLAIYFPNFVTHRGSFQFKVLIVPLIQLIMFGMGTTLTVGDFVRAANMRRGVATGVLLQYTVMPLMGFTMANLFQLEPEVAVGLILVSSCAGGVASNVITYIAGGNVALSVTMTAISTMVSPFATPLAMKLLAGKYVPVDGWLMMQSILAMIIAPIVLGILINRYARWLIQWAARWLPLVSMIGICAIITITIGLSHEKLMAVGIALLGASIMHNAAGLLLGYWGARAAGLNSIDSRTIAIEVGMQNGGMATGLAFNVLKSEVAALAAAVFGPWSAVSGSLIASYWSRKPSQTSCDKNTNSKLGQKNCDPQ